MKIGIFGDSYGEKSMIFPETAISKAWTTYIAEEFNTDNYCISGSSFYYSADLFLKNYHLYDKIIFLVTNPGRIELRPEFVLDGFPIRITGYEHANSKPDDKFFQVAADYFLYFQNFQEQCFFQYAAIDRLRSIKKDNILFLPCFFRSANPNEKNTTELFQISMLDETDPIFKKSGRINDSRHCHFNDQNNIIFAKNIKNWILNGVWDFDINDYVSNN